MPLTKQFNQLDPINNGTSAANNFKLSDSIPAQHSDVTGGVNKLVKRTFAQMLCEPVAVSNSNNPNNGAYTATCQNYPDFAVNYQDEQMSTHYYVGLKIRVIFKYGITYGSVSGGTYPTLNINSSGALPLLAQGKTMAAGAASNGQSLELTLIPYGNGYAWDADSNVRESTTDYTIYTDGNKQTKLGIKYLFKGVASGIGTNTHISVNGGYNGKTLLVIASGQWDIGDATASAMYLIRCGYNNNFYKVETIKEVNINNYYRVIFSINESGELILSSNSNTWSCVIISNEF